MFKNEKENGSGNEIESKNESNNESASNIKYKKGNKIIKNFQFQ